MKKFLSLILVFAMLLSLGLFLVSCGEDEQNPPTKEEIIAAAPKKTLAAFIKNPTLISSFNTAEKANGFDLDFECDDKLLGGFTSISMSSAANGKNTSSLISFGFSGEEYAIEIFSSDNALAIHGASIFGSDATLLINLDTFFDAITDSDLGKLIGANEINPEILEAMKKAANALKAVDASALVKEMKEIFPKEITEKAITENDVSVNYISVKVTATNTEIKALIDLLVSKIPEGILPEGTDITSGVAEIKSAIDEMEFALTSETLINSATGLITSLKTTVEAAQIDDEDDILNLDSTTTFSENEILAVTSVKTPEEEFTIESKHTSAVQNGETVLNSSIDITQGPMKFNVLNTRLTVAPDNSFTLSISETVSGILTGKPSGNTLTVSGSIINTQKSSSISVSSVSAMGKTVEFSLTLAFVVDAAVEKIPDNAKDITTLTEEEIGVILENIKNSPLAALIESFMPKGK